MTFQKIPCLIVTGIFFLSACKHNNEKPAGHPLFTLLPADSTNITFNNTLTEGINTNVLLYEYFYNGGGVATGDVNGDGLVDIYFTANMSDNLLYLNKGAMHFEDITGLAGTSGRPGPWKTGVTMADVNGDGRLDIYLCYSGKLRGEKRSNELYINTGNDQQGYPHFSEQAMQYGLADTGYSTQAYFFDADRDGDLDALLLNHNPNSLPILDEASTAALFKKEDPAIGVRLLRNDKNYFTDITHQAGISSSSLTYGLGAGIADINRDGWPDIYLSNDYAVPDYLYINNHDGTFTDQLQICLGHNSQFSMGNDIADINNDGRPDIYTLDMLPEDNHRQKLLFAPDNYEKFELNLRSGFYYQYMRNMLQLNIGGGRGETPAPLFSEIGQLAGISNTDWSWAPLLADYNNDGWKDLMVTNGFLRDYTNLDFIKYMNDYVQSKGRLQREDVLQLVHQIPASNVINYLFANNKNCTFSNVSAQWGFNRASNSNGAAYADLDNDGDLDLIINNINQPAYIYRNEARQQTGSHYLQVQLHGLPGNTQGIGAKLILYSKAGQQYLEQMPTRGYLSTVSGILHFGLGTQSTIDSLQIIWPRGKQQLFKGIEADQLLVVDEKEASEIFKINSASPTLFTAVKTPLQFKSPVNTINDFKRQPLLVSPLSFAGPCLAKGDMNGDGLEDVYAGGGSGQAAVLYLQQKDGRFLPKREPAFELDASCEDADAVIVDVNGDGYNDLYVASGGYHNYLPNDLLLQDRLYLNDGKANFAKSTQALPPMRVSKSCVRVYDYNNDGSPDLFVGGRVIPGRYPETPESFLLINDGKGYFANQITTIAPSLAKAGMITDAIWIDLNNDAKKDLVIVGEWMPVTVYISVDHHLQDQTSHYFNTSYRGWWNKIATGDFNKDGKPDLVIGNLGLNTQCRASDIEPANLYYKDFDDNGAVDPLFCFYIQGKSYPYCTRDELLDQISLMRTRFTDYKSYADAALQQIFTPEELKDVNDLEANYLQTVLFESSGTGKYELRALPIQTQYAPVYTITPLDYDNDGYEDLLLCGNMNRARLRPGKYDASYGQLLKNDGKGGFTYIDQQRSGFYIKGDVRSVLPINNLLLFGINQQPLQAYEKNK
ncbi:RNA-binding protein [Niastella yeongjuensis]|uniref:RNA-binding protein n=1 Tax=Niastella yeongjuensis TaxID=354355 RepID=A0A1V9EES4_9BACT|nr:VCBS repeat-containing protein [Niastella yeongjuensis]OQP44616.1 RNA-binding protein [Niastella yeongjuensis]SEO81250.1 Repeat domain-containing protein [Niastella yeongjuensis]